MKKTYFYQDDQKHLHRLQFVCLVKDTVLSNYILYKINQRKKGDGTSVKPKRQANELIRYGQLLQLEILSRFRMFQYSKNGSQT